MRQLINLAILSDPDLPVSQAWHHILEMAVRNEASDVHLSYQSDGMHIDLRIDGQLLPQGIIGSFENAMRITNHIKVMAQMDVGERRRPQSGRATALVDDRNVDLRISMLPSNHGPDVVLRILDRSVSLRSLEELGLMRRELNRLVGMITSPSGLILVTGPTGAGKTTTLYAILNRINDGTRKIITIENPIEFDLTGINQSQVNYRLGVGFNALLPTALQHDPDVIMIGEVRDTETAATAVRAAATGHLVFATMHATGTAEAIISLMNLGGHPHFVGRTLRGVIAQNLVRCLCQTCSERIAETEAIIPLDDIRHLIPEGETPALSMGKGCDNCHQSGYKGRMGLFEIMVADENLGRIIEQGGTGEQMLQYASEKGMLNIQQVGKLAAVRGQTTVEELLRTIPTKLEGMADTRMQ
jgi:type II secretory ATPase GspE/PulE/Tfp pilus assembly ATPase PilB-like protein